MPRQSLTTAERTARRRDSARRSMTRLRCARRAAELEAERRRLRHNALPGAESDTSAGTPESESESEEDNGAVEREPYLGRANRALPYNNAHGAQEEPQQNIEAATDGSGDSRRNIGRLQNALKV